MKNRNSWTISGRLGRETETRTLQSGDLLVSFSVAVDAGYKKNDEWVTYWVPVVVFNPYLAKIAEKLSKGSRVLIEGEGVPSKFEHNGETKYKTELVVPKFGGFIEMLDARQSNDDHNQGGDTGFISRDHDFDDSIPF